MSTLREKCPLLEAEGQTRDTASCRTVSPTHYRLSYSGPWIHWTKNWCSDWKVSQKTDCPEHCSIAAREYVASAASILVFSPDTVPNSVFGGKFQGNTLLFTVVISGMLLEVDSWQEVADQTTLFRVGNNNNENNSNDCIERRNSRFLQFPHCATNCLQHVCSSGQSAIVCKSCATHRALTACNMSCEETAQLLSLTEFKSHLF